jgi:hypothetical protein
MGDLMDQLAKAKVLSHPLFGAWVAENEAESLHHYFLETDEYRALFVPGAENKDIIYGPKGSGKSAIFCLLSHPSQELRRVLDERLITVIEAEATRGASVFRDLAGDFSSLETEFRGALRADQRSQEEIDERLDQLFEYLWKLYFLVLAGEYLRERAVQNPDASQVIKALEANNLLPERRSEEARFFLMRAARAVKDFVGDYLRRIHSVRPFIPPTPHAPGAGVEIVFFPPSDHEYRLGYRSVDELLSSANRALGSEKTALWLTIDHLDLAFSRNQSLENHAIGALLLRVYGEFRALNNIALKIFVRSDIWERLIENRKISKQSIADADKIDGVNLTWLDDDKLVSLIVRRFLDNRLLCDLYAADTDLVKRDPKAQRKLFFDIMPDQVDAGMNSIEWIMLWTKDGTGQTTPRDLIQLFNEAQQIQALSGRMPTTNRLLEAAALREAQRRVSIRRFRQALLAENPELQDFILALKGEPYMQTVDSLRTLWRRKVEGQYRMTHVLAENTVSRLRRIGLFVRDAAIPRFSTLKFKVKPETLTIAPIYQYALSAEADDLGLHDG